MIALALRYWRELFIAALCMALAVSCAQVSRARKQAAEARAELASDRATYAQATQAAESTARAEEARRAESTRKTIEEANAQLQTAQADAARAGDSAERLRQRVAALIAAARPAGANPNVAGRGEGQQSADALDLLVGMQSRIDGAAGQLGDYADQLRIAGAACERYGESLQPAAR